MDDQWTIQSVQDAAVKIFSNPLVAGFLGALISLRFVQQLSRRELMFVMVSGGVMAQELGPLAAHYLDADNFVGGISFAIGALGLSLLGAAYIIVKESPQIIRDRFSKPSGE